MVRKFDLGKVLVTSSIDNLMRGDTDFLGEILDALDKYKRADFSDMEYEEDIKMNYMAIENGNDRIFATYNTSKGKIYIITEWDRSVTTVLFPDEY